MTNHRLQIIGFFTLLSIATLVVLFMVWPFLKVIALASILAILFLPVYKRIQNKTGSEALAATITLVIVLLIVIIPLIILGDLLVKELVDLYNKFRGGAVNLDGTAILNNLPPQFRGIVENLNRDLGQRIQDFAGNVFNSVQYIGNTLLGFLLSFFLVFFSLFYLLRDGGKFKEFFIEVFPLSTKHENVLIAKLEKAVNGVVKGSFLVALIQAIVATIGFMIFGVPNPLLWGAFTFLAALVPTVGTSLSLIPAVVYLIIIGKIGAAVGLGIWGLVAVGLIDNVISPKLIGSRTNLHPLLVLLSVLGGIQLLGPLGFLLGPIFMAIFVALLDIYRKDLKEHLEK